jgi:circadian clock protein KaiC
MSFVPQTAPQASEQLLSSGIDGLDEVLAGGFKAGRLFLAEGEPGAGKTTLALQFLLAGARLGTPALCVTLSETAEEMRDAARSHGWSLDGVTILELVPTESDLAPDEQYTLFHPSEVELSETTKAILAEVERLAPHRVVIDSLSELRLLSGSPFRYRRQILAMKQFFARRGCTVLVLDDVIAGQDHDPHVRTIAHAVLRLERLTPAYGGERRRLEVVKYRAVRFQGGYHDFLIQRGGLAVFPRLVAREHRAPGGMERLGSGVPELDALLGGGLERGTSTLLSGAAGTGKSTLATQFAVAAAERGQKAALFIFDESLNTLLTRSDGLGIDLRRHVEAGTVTVRSVDPAELSPGEFAHAIRQAVESSRVSVVVVDSLNGYLNAMPEERFLIIHLHELLMYLGQMGVATILVSAHEGLIGGNLSAPVEASYLADAVILLRYFEARGEVRQAISVVKKRGGQHERTIREFKLAGGRISVGAPLRGFRGVLTGTPLLDPGPEPADPA